MTDSKTKERFRNKFCSWEVALILALWAAVTIIIYEEAGLDILQVVLILCFYWFGDGLVRASKN